MTFKKPLWLLHAVKEMMPSFFIQTSIGSNTASQAEIILKWLSQNILKKKAQALIQTYYSFFRVKFKNNKKNFNTSRKRQTLMGLHTQTLIHVQNAGTYFC